LAQRIGQRGVADEAEVEVEAAADLPLFGLICSDAGAVGSALAVETVAMTNRPSPHPCVFIGLIADSARNISKCL
jgi:hypothetical protein